MATDTQNAPELTQEQVQAILIQPLERASVFLAAGPRIFDTNGSPVRIPKLNSMGAPSWHGENEQITEVDPDFGEITLLPSTMASVKSLTRFSNELARQSVIALDAALRDRMVRDVAAKLDTAFIAGDGTPTGTGKATPVGLINYPGVQSIPTVATPSLDDLHDAEGLALAANVDPAALRWLMTSRDFVGIRKIKDLQDRYQVQPDPTEAGAYRLLGHGVTITNSIPATGPSATLATSAAADDIIDTTAAHGFVAGDQVVFTGLVGGAGLVDGTVYYVIATSLAASTFRVSATAGGAGINFTTDITAGEVGNDSTIVLADFSQIAVARDLAPSVKILDQTYGDFDQMAIRVVARFDAAPMNAEAVVLLEGVRP